MFMINLLSDRQEKVCLIGRNLSIYKQLMQQLETASRGTVFVLDMEQVKEVNCPGIHEVIVKPLEWIRDNYKNLDMYLFLINLSEKEEHMYNLKKTLRDENVIVLAKQEISFEIIGDIGEAVKELLMFAYTHKQITARFAADILGKKLNLVSTHLTRLYELRLLKREEEKLEEGGRQFIYSSIF